MHHYRCLSTSISWTIILLLSDSQLLKITFELALLIVDEVKLLDLWRLLWGLFACRWTAHNFARSLVMLGGLICTWIWLNLLLLWVSCKWSHQLFVRLRNTWGGCVMANCYNWLSMHQTWSSATSWLMLNRWPLQGTTVVSLASEQPCLGSDLLVPVVCVIMFWCAWAHSNRWLLLHLSMTMMSMQWKLTYWRFFLTVFSAAFILATRAPIQLGGKSRT